MRATYKLVTDNAVRGEYKGLELHADRGGMRFGMEKWTLRYFRDGLLLNEHEVLCKRRGVGEARAILAESATYWAQFEGCRFCTEPCLLGDVNCEKCDRALRDEVRRRNGYKPFTDAEYTQLCKELGRGKWGRGRQRGTVLVVNGGAL